MIFSPSSLTPISPGLVQGGRRVTMRASKDPVRQSTLSFSPTHVSVLRLSPETTRSQEHNPRHKSRKPSSSRDPAPRTFRPGRGYVRTSQQGRGNAPGELQPPSCVGIAVKRAYLSGQRCCPQLGLVAPGARSRASFLRSETVLIVTGTCWWTGGDTSL